MAGCVMCQSHEVTAIAIVLVLSAENPLNQPEKLNHEVSDGERPHDNEAQKDTNESFQHLLPSPYILRLRPQTG